jgi:hypothetical protein
LSSSPFPRLPVVRVTDQAGLSHEIARSLSRNGQSLPLWERLRQSRQPFDFTPSTSLSWSSRLTSLKQCSEDCARVFGHCQLTLDVRVLLIEAMVKTARPVAAILDAVFDVIEVDEGAQARTRAMALAGLRALQDELLSSESGAALDEMVVRALHRTSEALRMGVKRLEDGGRPCPRRDDLMMARTSATLAMCLADYEQSGAEAKEYVARAVTFLRAVEAAGHFEVEEALLPVIDALVAEPADAASEPATSDAAKMALDVSPRAGIRVIEIVRSSLASLAPAGAPHPSLAYLDARMAEVLFAMGRGDPAIKACDRLLSLETAYGEDYLPLVPTRFVFQASVLAGRHFAAAHKPTKQDLAQAERHLQRAISISEPEHVPKAVRDSLFALLAQVNAKSK